jgi:serine phosphatase RsbU (regulator of sigma subunit)
MGSAATKQPRVCDPSLRLQAGDSVRRRALARLHERRSAVDLLIGALERYQQAQDRLGDELAAATAAEKS